MNIKIYFDNKPLFLCNETDGSIEPLLHNPGTVFIEDSSLQALPSLIGKMSEQHTSAGIFVHPDLEELKKAFWEQFSLVLAGGGLVQNPKKEALLIFRRGKWDLPKGKLDPGETIEQCALREVQEETGLQHIHLQQHLLTTYHTYHEGTRFVLKESHWYNMLVDTEQPLVPQAAEQIAAARWISKDDLPPLLENTFPSVKDVLATGM